MKKPTRNYWLISTGIIILFIVFSFYNSMSDCPTCIGFFSVYLIPIIFLGLLFIILGFRKR